MWSSFSVLNFGIIFLKLMVLNGVGLDIQALVISYDQAFNNLKNQ